MEEIGFREGFGTIRKMMGDERERILTISMETLRCKRGRKP
jgi:hypothetical protein